MAKDKIKVVIEDKIIPKIETLKVEDYVPSYYGICTLIKVDDFGNDIEGTEFEIGERTAYKSYLPTGRYRLKKNQSK